VAGLDAIMIAPTRHLVAQLNRRAREHRLDHSTAIAEVRLADGNWASVGDVIITRSNDRRLRLAANDWVKNGDRWMITHVAKHGDLTVRHTRSQLSPPAHPRRRNRWTPTPPPADSRQRTRPPNSRRYGRRPRLASHSAHANRPGSAALPPPLHDHPVWGTYLAKRSQLVADLADQVQDHLCQSDRPLAWAAGGAHPTALIREIAVWRAANGIDPQDARPTGGFQLETAAALRKQRLDRHITRSTDSSGNETFNERQAANTALRPSQHDSRRLYQTPGQRPNGPAAPGR
jgi:hypothetical protein